MANLICSQCGTVHAGARKAQGSLLGEVALWVLMIIAAPYTLFLSIGVAVVFSIWRVFSKRPVCGSCKSEAVISVDSPKGRQLMAEINHHK